MSDSEERNDDSEVERVVMRKRRKHGLQVEMP